MQPIHDLLSSTSPPALLISAKGAAGGQGGTLFVSVTYDVHAVQGVAASLIQIDNQDKLARTFGCDVLSIDSAEIGARRYDPTAATAVFSSFYDRVVGIRESGVSAIVDCGALQSSLLFRFSQVAELDEELCSLGIPIVIFILVTASAESIRQASLTIAEAQRALPSARIVLVENQRDGALASLPRGSDAIAVLESDLAPKLFHLERIKMPRIGGNSWRNFERSHQRFISVIGMPVAEIVALTGLPRSEAKIARGEIALWYADMEAEISNILNLGGPDNVGA